jgi:hypothetical protein
MHGTRNTFPLTMRKLKNVTGMHIFNIPDCSTISLGIFFQVPKTHSESSEADAHSILFMVLMEGFQIATWHRVPSGNNL